MRCLWDTTWLWNTGQDKKNFLSLCFVLLCINQVCARPDFLDSMSRQFFGFMSDNNGQPQQQQHQPSPDPFAQMFGSASEQVHQRPPHQNYQNANQHRVNNPQRQGHYTPPHVVQQQVHLPYNGPPPVYGQQQGFGQRQPNSNETKTEGYPPDNTKSRHPYPPQHHHQAAQHYPPAEYHPQYQHQATAVEYHKPPATVVEYQTQYHQHPPQQVEYHHIPVQPAVVQEHDGPTLEILTGNDHAHHEPPTHVEYHHPPEVEYHHYTTHKPKRFHLSFNEPSPDYKIIDKHLKLPPVKFRFHINPKIVITSNTKDPLDKKHHDDEHDLEPYPPPDAFSDPNAPPSYNKHIVEHYPVKHHYPIEHHAVKHYAAEYPQAKHPYPVEHHVTEHHPGQEYVYDLSHGHSHLNPHRSLGHYEPTFKIKTKAMIFTEPPPTRPTTTPRPTTTTARTTTARTTTTTTTRPTRRARISARNPAFSVAFTQGSTIASTTDPSTTSTTTRRSIFRSNSERERENDGISARRDASSTSAETPQSTVTRTTTTISTTTTTTPKPVAISTTTTVLPTTTTTTTTTQEPTTTTTTTSRPTTTTTTTSRPATTTTTTSRPTTTTTTSQPTSTTTTPRPTTASTSTTVTERTTTTAATQSSTAQTPNTVTTSTIQPVSRSMRITPAEETTLRTTTLSNDANEIDMRKATEVPRRRPEPLQDESSSVARSESYNFESSESVKVIETTMLIDGKNQTVRFYYITQPVKLPLDVFQKMTGQANGKPSGINVIKIRDKRNAVNVSSIQNRELEGLHDQ